MASSGLIPNISSSPGRLEYIPSIPEDWEDSPPRKNDKSRSELKTSERKVTQVYSQVLEDKKSRSVQSRPPRSPPKARDIINPKDHPSFIKVEGFIPSNKPEGTPLLQRSQRALYLPKIEKVKISDEAGRIKGNSIIGGKAQGKKYNETRIKMFRDNLKLVMEIQTEIALLKKDFSKNTLTFSAKEKILSAVNDEFFETIKVIINDSKEMEFIIEDDVSLALELLTQSDSFLLKIEEGKGAINLANFLLKNVSENHLSKLVNFYIQKHVEKQLTIHTVLRDTTNVMGLLRGLFQTEKMKGILSDDLKTIIHNHISHETCQNFKKLGKLDKNGYQEVSYRQKKVMKHTKLIFENLLASLESHRIPKVMASMYKTLFESMTVKWSTEYNEVLRRIASAFFLVTFTRGLTNGNLDDFTVITYNTQEDRDNAVIIAKTVTSVVNNNPPEDLKMNKIKDSSFISDCQEDVKKIAMALMSEKK